MKEVDTQTIRCTFYRAEWDQAEAAKFIGKVNSNPLLVAMPKLGFRANYPAGTLKVREYGGRSEIANRKAFWSITIEVIYKPDGWCVEVLGTGICTIVAPGEPKLPHRVGAIDPDPDSEQWESTTWSAPVIERMGNTPIEQAVDQNGNPIAVAGHLDGQGQMLPAGQEPVYLKYQIYEETSFSTPQKLVAHHSHRFRSHNRPLHPSQHVAAIGRIGWRDSRAFGAIASIGKTAMESGVAVTQCWADRAN